MNENLMLLTDGYKLDHRRQYPVGTRQVLSNFTPRSTRLGGVDSVVFFGLQYFLRKYLMEEAERTFFSRPLNRVTEEYQRRLDGYLGPNQIGTDHIADLWRLGYIPLEFRALPEGTSVPYRIPMFTVENTRPEFFWLTNYFETLMSNILWMPCTSASTARRYRKLLDHYASVTGGPKDFVQWQGHDFSFRGMAGVEAASLSGAGHLLSFTGTDSIPSIELLEKYYHGEGLIGGSVPATEHSVMCAGEKDGEIDTFKHLLNLYPSGILSVVSDTWDLWEVIGNYLPQLKDQIMAREGKLVIRPDSGDPVLILTGDASAEPGSLAHKGVVEALWDIFGGTVNTNGFRELDSHIGTIYGDSITEERARQISERLVAKRFATINVVYGIGSFTYQYVTRDTNGFALKATWADVNGQERLLQKDPKTDNSGKKSARGRLVVVLEQGKLSLIDNLSYDQWNRFHMTNLLQKVWANGRFVKEWKLAEIRQRVQNEAA